MDSNEAYKAPAPEPIREPTAEPKPLGSLAQSARGNELKQARTILIVIGVLTAATYAFRVLNTPNEVNQVLQQEIQNAGGAAQFDAEEVENSRRAMSTFCYAVYGGTLAVGVLFIIFGIIIQKYPVAITITSLVLYVLLAVGHGLLEPMSLGRGLIVRIIIVVALFRAVNAARAYQAHTQKATLAPEFLE